MKSPISLTDYPQYGGRVTRREPSLPVVVGPRDSVEVTRRRDGLLTPAEILALRTELELSQSAFERVRRVGPKTVVRWERATVVQNRSTDRLLRLLRDVSEARAYLIASGRVA